jgi:FkbM family methyltransferase
VRLLIKLLRELTGLFKVADTRSFLVYLKSIIMNLGAVARGKSLQPADKAMAGRECVFRINGDRIVLDGSLFGPAREIYSKRVYFTPPGFRIEGGGVVVDLGANAGVFTVLAALRARRVIAVEAQSGFIEEIKQNLEMNGCADGVSVVFGIVGHNKGVLSDPARLRSASHFKEEPPVLSLDGIMADYGVRKIDFLKIDIEGSEFDLFQTDCGWLSSVDLIAMEVHSEFGGPSELGGLLKERGFRIWYADKDQRLVDELKGPFGFIFAKNSNLTGAADG